MKPALLAVSTLAIAVTALVAVAAVGRFVDGALRHSSAVTDLIAVALAVAASTDVEPDPFAAGGAPAGTTRRYAIVDMLACWPDDDGSCESTPHPAPAAPTSVVEPARRTVIVKWSPATRGAVGDAARHRPSPSDPPNCGAIYLLGDTIAGIEVLACGRSSPARQDTALDWLRRE